MYYTASQPASNPGYLQRKRHNLRVDFVRQSTQTTSTLLRHMFNFIITLHCGSSLLCWFDWGVRSTSHGLTLSVDLFIWSSAAYPTSDGPMEVFRYMKTLRSYLVITARLTTPRLLAFGINDIRTMLIWPL